MANLIPFTKRFESSENLVNLLESRGLQIYDRNKAIQYLDNIGYYRLSAYMYPLLKMPKTAHLYKEGSSFKKVMMLYRFDKKLRLLMFNEIEKIAFYGTEKIFDHLAKLADVRCLSSEEQEKYDESIKAADDYYSGLYGSYIEGEEKGIAKEKIDTAYRLLSMGLSEAQVSTATELPLEEIQKMRK